MERLKLYWEKQPCRKLKRGPTTDRPSMPRWVKVFGIIALVLVHLVVIIMFTGVSGEHGPGRHTPSGGTGGHTALEHEVQQP